MAKTETNQDIFDIHPTAVKNWVQQLPLGSIGESSKLIFHALQKVNQQNNRLDHHLEFLEAITPTLVLFYPRLSQHFSNVSLPINNKTRNVIHVTTSLLNEALISYQFIFNSLLQKKPFGWKKPFSLALHRTIFYSSHIFCTQRLTYQPYSRSAWHTTYSCIQFAEKHNLLNKKHKSFYSHQNTTSIDFEFKRLLLLSLLSAEDLSQNNMDQIHELMPLWIKYTDLTIAEADEKATCFSLNLLNADPPYLYGSKSYTDIDLSQNRYLSTSRLKKLLAGYSYKIENNDAIQIGKSILSKNSIEALLNAWSRNHLRTGIRHEGTGFVDIITGITGIHFVLNKQDQPAYDEVSVDIPDNIIDFESTLIMEPVNNLANNSHLNLTHFLSNTEQEEDVWGKVYENKINEPLASTHWSESGSHKSYSFSKSILLDYSDDGYRLSVNEKNIDSLKHNEMVAVREHALAPWALAQAKWLHFSKVGDLQFGLRILSHHVLPVSIRYEANNGLSEPLPSLLGLDRKKLMLFIPTLPTNLNGKKLELEHQKQHSQIHLKNKLLSSPSFDVYEILETQPDDRNEPTLNTATKPITNLDDTIWETF